MLNETGGRSRNTYVRSSSCEIKERMFHLDNAVQATQGNHTKGKFGGA